MEHLLSTGSTLLNLACSGRPDGGFLAGKYFFLVGDSASGKTFLAMTCFAEAVRNEHFKNYRLIYDNIEDGMLLDLDHFFGEAVADKVEPPAGTQDAPEYSATIEEFYFHLADAVDRKQPFIYVLDSMDALDSESAGKKFEQHRKAFHKKQGREEGEGKKEEKLSGSYGDGKAKMNSQYIRKAVNDLRETGSILIILCQTRDDIGSMYGGKTRSGGHALRFYATVEIWTKIVESLKKEVHGIKRELGVRVEMQIRKNRITGRRYTVSTDIYPEIGIDDVGSCADYLVEEGFWPKGKQTIEAKGLEIEGTREKVIRLIEKRGLQKELQRLCGECWQQVEEACSLNRRPRYSDE